jgi:hypothetical protein
MSMVIRMPNWRFKMILVLAALLLIAVPAGAQDETPSFYVGPIDTENFPEIGLRFWALDDGLKPVPGLTGSAFTIYEGDSPVDEVELVEQSDGPVRLVYLLDLGQYLNFKSFGYPVVRRALSYPVDDGLFNEGTDLFHVLARSSDGSFDRTIELQEPSSNAVEILSFINSFAPTPGDGPTEILRGVEEFLQERAEAPSSEWLPTAVLVFTHIVEKPGGQEAADEAERIGQAAFEVNVPIYVFQTSQSSENAFPLQVLAHESGGAYLRLDRLADQRADLARIYEEITSARTYYQATYRSQSGASGPRFVSVAPPGASPGQTGSSGSYEVELQPPAVSLDSPVVGDSFSFEVDTDAEGVQVFSPKSLPFGVTIDGWPDGYPRQIARAEILVGEEVVGSASGPFSGGLITFGWDLGPLESLETVTLPLRVRLTDEVGLQAETAAAEVELSFREGGGFPLSCFSSPINFGCIVLFAVPPLLCLGLFVFLGGGVLLTRGRSPSAPAGRAQPEPLHTIVAGGGMAAAAEALAQLHVVIGPPDWVGRELPIEEYDTRLGRDPSQTDLTFYAGQATSISGLHCILRLSIGKFYLIDNHSTNGTRVNGQKLVADQPHELHDGDEIDLGDLSLKGVRLHFSQGAGAHGKAGLGETLIERREGLETAVDAPGKAEASPGSSPDSGERQDDDWLKQLG